MEGEAEAEAEEEEQEEDVPLEAEEGAESVNESHLLAVVADLGERRLGSDGSRLFRRGQQCRACLADLVRFLKRDAPGARPAFFALARLQLVGHGIGPLMASHGSQSDLSLPALKALALMTLPPDESELANAPVRERIHSTLEQCKNELLDTLAPTAVAQLLADLMEKFRTTGTRLGEPDDSILQLLLSVVRNLLSIEDDARGSERTASPTARDRLVTRLFDEGILDMVALAAGHARKPPFRDEASLIAEIYHLAFRGATPRALADAMAHRKKHFERGEEQPEHQCPEDGLPHEPSRARARKGQQKNSKPSDALLAVMESTRKPTISNRPRMSGAYVRLGEGATGKSIVKTSPWNSSSSSAAAYGGSSFGRSKPRLNGQQKVAVDEKAGVSEQGPLKAMAEHLHTLLVGGHANELIAQLVDDVHHGRELGMTSTEVRLRKRSTFSLASLLVGFRLEEHRASVHTSSTGIRLGEADEAVSSRMLTVARLEWQRASDEKDWEQVDAAGRALEAVMRALRSAIEAPYAEGDAEAASAIAQEALHDDSEQGIISMLHRLLKRFDPRKQPRTHAHGLALGLNSTLRLLETLSKAHNSAGVRSSQHNAEDESMKRKTKLFEPQMIVNHVWILRQCNANPIDVNEAAVAFLSRARNAGFEPMLYQLSVLRVLHAILNDSAAKRMETSKPVYHFSSSLTSSFLQRLVPADDASQETKGAAAMLFVDILSWKTRQKAWNIEADLRGRSARGDDAEAGSKRKRRSLLSDEELEELADLWARHVEQSNPLEAIANDHSATITAHQARYQLRKLGLTVRVKSDASKAAAPAGRGERRKAREERLNQARADRTEQHVPGEADDDDEDAIDADDEDEILPPTEENTTCEMEA
jgi:hypothetical protein